MLVPSLFAQLQLIDTVLRRIENETVKGLLHHLLQIRCCRIGGRYRGIRYDAQQCGFFFSFLVLCFLREHSTPNLILKTLPMCLAITLGLLISR